MLASSTEAVERLNRAIELEPRNGMSYGRLADVYALMGRYDEALRLYEQAACAGERAED